MSAPKHSVILADNVIVRERSVQSRLLRIVRSDGPQGYVWLFDLAGTGWPYPVEHSTMMLQLSTDDGNFELVSEDPWSRPAEMVEPSAKSKLIIERRWRLTRLMTDADDGRAILYRNTRSDLVKVVSESQKAPRSLLERILKLYWQRGMSITAMVPNFSKCGGRGKKRKSDKKLGRKRTISSGVGALNDDVLQKRMSIAAAHYLNSSKMTQEDALRKVWRRFYRNIDGELSEERPTEKQFRYYLSQNYTHSHRYRAREGQKAFNLNARGLGGSGQQNTSGPGDVFQIDATVADIYLVSKLDANRIVGRPTVYFVVDVWSRLITGMYVGFEGPSWAGAMMALVNMVTPKTEFCAQYGIDIAEEQWPSHFAPKAIMADKGELASTNLAANIIDGLRIRITNAATGRPDLKAIVERKFGTVQAKFSTFVPGYVRKDFGVRGARDYRLGAKLTLRDFTEIMIHCVIEHNCDNIRGIKTPAGMTTDEREATAVERWHWGIQNRSGSLQKRSIDEVALNVMPRDTARVTAEGIKFKGGFYTCETERLGGWRARARLKGTWTVEICYDPRSLDQLYLLQPNTTAGFERCELMAASSDLHGVSLFEYEEVEDAQKRLKADGETKRQERKIRADEAIEKIVNVASKRADAERDPDLPKTRRTAGIQENKHAEKKLERKSEAFDLAKKVDAPPVAPALPREEYAKPSYKTKFLTGLKAPSRESEDEK